MINNLLKFEYKSDFYGAFLGKYVRWAYTLNSNYHEDECLGLCYFKHPGDCSVAIPDLSNKICYLGSWTNQTLQTNDLTGDISYTSHFNASK